MIILNMLTYLRNCSPIIMAMMLLVSVKCFSDNELSKEFLVHGSISTQKVGFLDVGYEKGSTERLFKDSKLAVYTEPFFESVYFTNNAVKFSSTPIFSIPYILYSDDFLKRINGIPFSELSLPDKCAFIYFMPFFASNIGFRYKFNTVISANVGVSMINYYDGVVERSILGIKIYNTTIGLDWLLGYSNMKNEYPRWSLAITSRLKWK